LKVERLLAVGEVFPCGIVLFDERDLLCAIPVFQFVLAGNGAINVGDFFVMGETVNVIASGEGSRAILAVLGYAGEDVVGQADIEGS